jgi:hypothetical protein
MLRARSLSRLARSFDESGQEGGISPDIHVSLSLYQVTRIVDSFVVQFVGEVSFTTPPPFFLWSGLGGGDDKRRHLGALFFGDWGVSGDGWMVSEFVEGEGFFRGGW